MSSGATLLPALAANALALFRIFMEYTAVYAVHNFDHTIGCHKTGPRRFNPMQTGPADILITWLRLTIVVLG